MRSVGVGFSVAGTVLIIGAIFQQDPDLVMLAGGIVTLFSGIGILFVKYEVDLLGDPLDEDELRRRRGAAGWQKPVRPPTSDRRPGGLPPRNRGMGYIDVDDPRALYPCSWCGSTQPVCHAGRGGVCVVGRPTVG